MAQLWTASDHLLLSTSRLGFEQYRRFYFHEVEALIIRRTATGRVWSIVLALTAVLCGAGVILVLQHGNILQLDFQSALMSLRADVAFGLSVATLVTLTALALLGLLINLLLGPTCTMHLQTRPGLESLRMVRRWSAARKMREKLLPLLAGAQNPAVQSPADYPPSP